MRWVVMTLAMASLTGCASDNGLRIIVDETSGGLDGRIDRLELTLVASQTDPRETGADSDDYLAYTCGASREVFVGERLGFPLVVAVHRGDRFVWECVALRVQGFVGDSEVIRDEELFCSDMENNVDEVYFYLHPECLGFRCAPGETCNVNVEGEPDCGPSDVHMIFEVPPAVNDDCA